MNWKLSLAAAAAVLAVSAGAPAWAQSTRVAAGSLTCNASSGWGFIFGSTTDLNCTYSDSSGKAQHYTGKITKIGVDIGYHEGGVLVWVVLAPTGKIGRAHV